jgi:two-component system invasion response regulator UvrY
VKILIADDHTMVRKGLKMILAVAYPHALIEGVSDGAALLAKLDEQEWSVIVCDVSMPGVSGAVVIKQVKDKLPKTPVLMLSTHSAEQYAVRMIKAGASGYLTKESAPEELVKAVEQVMSGKKYITSEVAELLADSATDDFETSVHQNLSDREFEVFKLIAQGKSVSEVGEALFLSVNTISTYRARILAKMHLQNNADLIRYAIENQLF